MVDWNGVRERLGASRRRFSETWSLFQESKIGVAGIGIMLIFVALALFAPYMQLRDPIHWRAPSEDVIELETFWATNTSTFLFEAGDPIGSSIAVRVIPRATDPRADRIYAASGDKLLAIDPVTGTRGWRTPFQASSEITSEPVVVNLGSKIDPARADQVVFIGTADGTLYALNDSTSGGETGSPGGAAVTSVQVKGAVTSISVYSDELPGRSPAERVYVGTSEGHLYAFAADGLDLLWERVFASGTVVRMAGGSLNPATNPTYSRSLTEDGSRLFVNAGDWYGLYADNGTLAWSQPFPVSNPWTSAPVVALPSLVGGDFAELVYAVSDDGWLFARHALTGEPLAAWESSPVARLHPSGVRAVPVMKTSAERDPGPLHTPLIESTTIYVASESGYMYSITRDPVGTLDAGDVRWRFTDRLLEGRGFQFVAPPAIQVFQRFVYGVAVDPQGTADPSDDVGIVYSLTEDGGLSWRREFDGILSAAPAIWSSAGGEQLVPSLWIGTSEGWVYSISSTGLYLAPLAPGTYPSGNTYVWGTDDQGRDIFSQFIWGSRIALVVGFASALLSVGIGTIIGLVAGYVGRKTDAVLMRFTDVILVLPGLPLLIVLSAVLGTSIVNIIIVIAILGWPGTARVIRSEVLSLKERPYIHSARVTGASNIRIMFRHLAPNVMPLVFLYMTFAVSGAILLEAALSFLGLGDINTPSWGTMLSTIQSSDLLRAYWWLFPPGLGITLLSLAFFLVGRAFEQVINPRLRTR